MGAAQSLGRSRNGNCRVYGDCKDSDCNDGGDKYGDNDDGDKYGDCGDGSKIR